MAPQASQAHDITAIWHTDLPDHAGLLVIPAAVVRRADTCQPYRLVGLPPEAWQDLRRRYVALSRRFGCSQSQSAPLVPVGHQRGRRFEFLAAAETDEVTGRTFPSGDQDDHSEPVSRNDLLIQFGRAALQVELCTWRKRWKRKSRVDNDSS
eukprot:8366103-Alexandrium_andersonii.AAC.1